MYTQYFRKEITLKKQTKKHCKGIRKSGEERVARLDDSSIND